jgi:glucans biosynthesis protein
MVVDAGNKTLARDCHNDALIILQKPNWLKNEGLGVTKIQICQEVGSTIARLGMVSALVFAGLTLPATMARAADASANTDTQSGSASQTATPETSSQQSSTGTPSQKPVKKPVKATAKGVPVPGTKPTDTQSQTDAGANEGAAKQVSDASTAGAKTKKASSAGTSKAQTGDQPPAVKQAQSPDQDKDAATPDAKAKAGAQTETPTDAKTNAKPADDANQAKAPQPVTFSPDMVIDRARELAKKPFENPHRDLPASLADLKAAQYNKIKFRDDQAFFKGSPSGFSMELYHPGYMYDVPVSINVIEDGKVKPVPYSTSLFDTSQAGISDNDVGSQGYAGLRLKYPLDTVTSNEEIASFLGASYFRVMGRDQVPGPIARALAIDLAGPSGEEIPVFREFWVQKPADDAQTVTVYALLDSKRVTGAYQFDITPGERTVTSVKATLFFRDKIEKLGIAPLSSMYLYGEQKRRHFNDYRNEVHSSDGLLIHNGQGEWLWRPLENPQHLQISSFLDQNPKGFGLLQRDRDFDHYQDETAHFEKRPGYWVKPKGDWGKGHVELVEIPSPDETNENIVVFWVPDAKPVAGSSITMSYDLVAMTKGRDLRGLARAGSTRISDIAPKEGDTPTGHRFILNFSGGDLDYYLSDVANIKADISASSAKVSNVSVVADKENGGVRVIFDIAATGDAPTSNLRAFIRYKNRVLSETWTMPWTF